MPVDSVTIGVATNYDAKEDRKDSGINKFYQQNPQQTKISGRVMEIIDDNHAMIATDKGDSIVIKNAQNLKIGDIVSMQISMHDVALSGHIVAVNDRPIEQSKQQQHSSILMTDRVVHDRSSTPGYSVDIKSNQIVLGGHITITKLDGDHGVDSMPKNFGSTPVVVATLLDGTEQTSLGNLSSKAKECAIALLAQIKKFRQLSDVDHSQAINYGIIPALVSRENGLTLLRTQVGNFSTTFTCEFEHVLLFFDVDGDVKTSSKTSLSNIVKLLPLLQEIKFDLLSPDHLKDLAEQLTLTSSQQSSARVRTISLGPISIEFDDSDDEIDEQRQRDQLVARLAKQSALSNIDKDLHSYIARNIKTAGEQHFHLIRNEMWRKIELEQEKYKVVYAIKKPDNNRFTRFEVIAGDVVIQGLIELDGYKLVKINLMVAGDIQHDDQMDIKNIFQQCGLNGDVSFTNNTNALHHQYSAGCNLTA